MTKNIITLALAGTILALSTTVVNAQATDNLFNKLAAFPTFPDDE